MRPSILIVARQSPTLLGLANAVLKFGYQIMTAYPEPEELARLGSTMPSLVLLRPASEEGMIPFLRIVRERFHDRGVPVVLGTDTGNPYVFPGYSVHRELELLVRAGLTPMEALAAATRRASAPTSSSCARTRCWTFATRAPWRR